MKQKKSVLEQALLQVEALEDAVRKNAKGILASSMKQELNELIKESSKEYIHSKKIQNEKFNKNSLTDKQNNEDDFTNDEEPSEENTDVKSFEPEYDSNSDENPNLESSDSENVLDSENDEEDLENDDEDLENDDDVLDLTHASKEEVFKVFKALKPEDGIIVKKDGENLEFSIDDDDYIIKPKNGSENESLNEGKYFNDEFDEFDEDEFDTDIYEDETDPEFDEIEIDINEDGDETDPDFDEDIFNERGVNKRIKVRDNQDDFEDDDEDSSIYEIELDEEDDEELNSLYSNLDSDLENYEKSADSEFKESARTLGYGYRGGLKSKKTFYAGNKRNEINEEIKRLKLQNEEYKKALLLFKEKLNEVAVFNTNLALATKLFTEQVTTKNEKIEILKRFDTVSTINESKKLYSQIKVELGKKKPISEVVEEKLISTPKSSSSKETLSESKSYENPQFKRIKDLIKKIN